MRMQRALVLTLAALSLDTAPAGAAPRCANPNGPAPRAIAYALGECRQDAAGGYSGGERILVRRGDCDPVVIAEITKPGPVKAQPGLCELYGKSGYGAIAVAIGGLQWLRITPDGSGVVFELSNRFATLPQIMPDVPQDGIFFARSDGRAPARWLGPPLLTKGFTTSGSLVTPENPIGIDLNSVYFSVVVSPHARTVAFLDPGPGPDGREAPQIWVLDIATGKRRQLTSFPAPGPVPALSDAPCCLSFVNEHTLAFVSGPLAKYVGGRIKTNGRGLRFRELTPIGGGTVVRQLSVLGGRTQVETVQRSPPGPDGTGEVVEVYLARGPNVLQLTKFGRADTRNPILAGNRALFIAGVDLFGDNPSHLTQLFSIGPLGAGLRRLTHLVGTPERPCRVREGLLFDPVTRTVIFNSVCDPFGTNPSGEQLFAIRDDGSGLRQLTNVRGYAIDPDGTAHAELLVDYEITQGH